jgi:hypothetical protein
MTQAQQEENGTPIDRTLSPAARRAAQAQKRAALIAKRQQALACRLAGATFEEIARQLGYGDKSAARKAVQAALQAPGRKSRTEGRRLCRMRYERLLLTWWPGAIAGDAKATDRVLGILDDLRSLDALDQPRRHKMEHTGENGGPIVLKNTSAPDLSRLTDEQLQQYQELIDHLLAGQAPGPGPDSLSVGSATTGGGRPDPACPPAWSKCSRGNT